MENIKKYSVMMSILLAHLHLKMKERMISHRRFSQKEAAMTMPTRACTTSLSTTLCIRPCTHPRTSTMTRSTLTPSPTRRAPTPTCITRTGSQKSSRRSTRTLLAPIAARKIEMAKNESHWLIYHWCDNLILLFE